MKPLDDPVIAKVVRGQIELFFPADPACVGNIVCYGTVSAYPLGMPLTKTTPMCLTEASMGYFRAAKKPRKDDPRVGELIKRYESEVQAWANRDAARGGYAGLRTKRVFKDTVALRAERWKA